jgi:prevent-host-death family protein
MKEIGAYEAKTRFSELLRNVSKGKEYLITNHGKPVARLLKVNMGAGRDSAEVVQDLLSFTTAKPCSDISLNELKDAINKGRR